ncbi:MAG: nitroreductase [Aristaeellaceae bacterium]
MNETMEAMLTRRSCRKYKPDMLPRPVLEEILQAGTYAATGMGKQSPIIIAVTSKAMRDRLSAMNAAVMGKGPDVDPFYGAPVVLVVLADRSIGTHLYDGSLVMGNLMLAAHAHGIGSCWIHRAKEEFDSPEGKAILAELGITGDYVGIGHCILGYPEEGGFRTAAPRKDDYVHWVE